MNSKVYDVNEALIVESKTNRHVVFAFLDWGVVDLLPRYATNEGLLYCKRFKAVLQAKHEVSSCVEISVPRGNRRLYF